MNKSKRDEKLNILFYILLILSLLLSFGAMYVNLMINKNFHQFTADDERPDPFKPFIYSNDNEI